LFVLIFLRKASAKTIPLLLLKDGVNESDQTFGNSSAFSPHFGCCWRQFADRKRTALPVLESHPLACFVTLSKKKLAKLCTQMVDKGILFLERRHMNLPPGKHAR